MKYIPVKMGPMALLLTVISICMTALAILTFTTAWMDLGTAEKYADTVQNRYELEVQGQQYLQEAEEAQIKGLRLNELPGTETDENGLVWKRMKADDSSLVIGIKSGETEEYQVVSWKMEKAWAEDTDVGSLWSGKEEN